MRNAMSVMEEGKKGKIWKKKWNCGLRLNNNIIQRDRISWALETRTKGMVKRWMVVRESIVGYIVILN